MYLDPGFGGMLLQVIVAIAAAGGAALFALRKKLRTVFSKNKNNEGLKPASKPNNYSEDGVIDVLSDDD